MASRQHMQSVACDDRKRLRESVREVELPASPKKGKHEGGAVPDAFSFPAFAAPLEEIAKQCHATEHGGRKHGDSCQLEVQPQATPSVINVWQELDCSARLHDTPEPQGSLSFDKSCDERDQSITPALDIAEHAAAMPVQTLHARAMPLSPFEWGGIPDEHAATPTSEIQPVSPHENACADGDGSILSPGALPVENHAVSKLCCTKEAQQQFALIQDVSMHSQNASQSSSLAETKILRPSNRLQSRDASDGSRESFKFSKAFSFKGLLGHTKTSTVYFAQAADGLFAIKEMKKPFSSKADRAEMMRELRAVYALPTHDNVVNYVRFWQEARKLHIQMELCQGGSLDMLLKRSEISQDENLDENLLWLILSDAAHGLRHIHAHGVLHMDIKPENMFLDSSGTFKLGDFGLAISLCSESSWEEGDGRYVAPELLRRSQPPSGAADVYSLGAAMLHCAIGTSLPMERSPQTVCRYLAGHGYSAEFQDIVASMIATSSQDRPTAEIICNKLQQKNVTRDVQGNRSKLAQVAHTVHAHRIAQQSTLHCSPSFSLSQSVDNATPGSVGQPTIKHERAWTQLFSVKSKCGAHTSNGAGRSPGSAMPPDRAPVPPVPFARDAVDRGPQALAVRGQAQSPKVGTPPSVVPKLHQHQRRYHRSPSAGSFDRCGALSYSSNGQASGSLNLELYPDLGTVSCPGDGSAGMRNQAGARSDEPTLQQQRQSILRPDPFHGRARKGISHTNGVPAAGRSRKPLTQIVSDGRDPVQPSPRSDVLHRYFSSQTQHQDSSLRPQIPLPNASTAALSQVEVTGPYEANTESATNASTRKHRQRRTAVPRPPDLHELKGCFVSGHRMAARPPSTLRAASKTKGRAMVWKGLQDVTPAAGSCFGGIVSAVHETEGNVDKHARQEPLKCGHATGRRSRGTKIVGVAAGVMPKDQENDGVLANAGHHAGVLSCTRQRDGQQSLVRPANAIQPHQTRLRAVKTLHVSRAREMSTEVLASSRPELKQPLAVCHAHNRGV